MVKIKRREHKKEKTGSKWKRRQSINEIEWRIKAKSKYLGRTAKRENIPEGGVMISSSRYKGRQIILGIRKYN